MVSVIGNINGDALHLSPWAELPRDYDVPGHFAEYIDDILLIDLEGEINRVVIGCEYLVHIMVLGIHDRFGDRRKEILLPGKIIKIIDGTLQLKQPSHCTVDHLGTPVTVYNNDRKGDALYKKIILMLRIGK